MKQIEITQYLEHELNLVKANATLVLSSISECLSITSLDIQFKEQISCLLQQMISHIYFLYFCIL